MIQITNFPDIHDRIFTVPEIPVIHLVSDRSSVVMTVTTGDDKSVSRQVYLYNGAIDLDIRELIVAMLEVRDRARERLEIRFRVGSESAGVDLEVLRSSVHIEQGGEGWLNENFLSLIEDKEIPPGGFDYLSMFPLNTCPAMVINYADGNRKGIKIGEGEDLYLYRGIPTVEIDFSGSGPAAKNPAYAVITDGERRRSYWFSDMLDVALMVTNPFGVREILYLYGYDLAKLKTSGDVATVAGYRLPVSQKDETTGVLMLEVPDEAHLQTLRYATTQGIISIADDLSPEGMRNFREIVPVSFEAEYSDDSTEYITVQLTYRERRDSIGGNPDSNSVFNDTFNTVFL